MKKILIVINNMKVGGIQKSLLELLKALSKRREYDVSLFCCKQAGAFLNRVPENINILPENAYAAAAEQALYECKSQGIRYYFFRLIMSVWSRFFTKALPATILCKLVGVIGENYDIAISYSQPIEDHSFCNITNELVLNCTRAERKITFVHCDFKSYGGNTKRNRKLYTKFDRIATVSTSVGKRFAEAVPEVSEKIQTVYNCCDLEEIERLALEEPITYNKTSFVTIARLSEEKGLLRCIPVFDRLRREGFDFEWHIVGGGPMKSAIEEEIGRFSLEHDIVLEGEQLNPYRYLKNADYFILPSFHEAAPIVFDEAIALGVPILTTETLSAKEMVESRGCGIVCDNSEDAIYDMLRSVITNVERFNISKKPENKVCMEQFDILCNF